LEQYLKVKIKMILFSLIVSFIAVSNVYY
jgi:hypothetical protein